MDFYDSVYKMVMGIVLKKSKIGTPLVPKEIEDIIKNTIKQLKVLPIYADETIDEEVLFRDIMTGYTTLGGGMTTLEDSRDHQEWLANERADIRWDYWRRYKDYLTGKMAPAIIDTTDFVTDEILKRIESPRRKGNWDRRGMVVGNIQSGKTSNYIGVICKAVDAGYKVIVVLAGLNNDLRSQTQKRIDQGFLGRDTSKKDSINQVNNKIGVGLNTRYIPSIKINAVTSSLANGDFKTSVYKNSTISLGSDPVIAVVKKNVTPLKNLLKWFSGEAINGKIKDVPFLLIDDEADNASIDTKATKKIGISPIKVDEEENPTAVNGLIRKILNLFSQSAYIGYTATPFANIFIYPDDEEMSKGKFGENLYPRSFIINLHAPSNYLGPSQVFGLYKDKFAGIDEKKPLPLIRMISDYENIIPEKHKKDLDIEMIPDSLKQAIYSFILSCAVRYVRGLKQKHNSMLIHVTRFVDVQTKILEIVNDFMISLSRQLEFKTGPQYKSLYISLKELWEKDFIPTMNVVLQNFADPNLKMITWGEIEPYLYKVASKIEVKAINGKAADGGLDYDSYPNGCSVIAVGGDKLSRGLTLEGLSISYYTRVSKTYDTLLQMGRWFGYRTGYEDVCRLYTSKKLAQWYQHIAVVNEEFRQELDEMAELPNATPENYGLKVRTHPDGMLITAMNKMRNSETREVTYAGKLIQITRFYKNDSCNKDNLKFTKSWLEKLGKRKPEKIRNNFIWEDIRPNQIFDFLKNIRIHPSCFDAAPDIVTRYIKAQNEDNELINWTVALISLSDNELNNRGLDEVELKKRKFYFTESDYINMPWRTDVNAEDSKNTENEYDYVSMPRNNLITETDQNIDLTEEQKKAALNDTIQHFKPTEKRKVPPDKPSPIWIRAHRPKTNGLLLVYIFRSGRDEIKEQHEDTYVGYGISFPGSNTAKPIEYKVDEVYLAKYFEDEGESE